MFSQLSVFQSVHGGGGGGGGAVPRLFQRLWSQVAAQPLILLRSFWEVVPQSLVAGSFLVWGTPLQPGQGYPTAGTRIHPPPGLGYPLAGTGIAP